MACVINLNSFMIVESQNLRAYQALLLDFTVGKTGLKRLNGLYNVAQLGPPEVGISLQYSAHCMLL